MSGIIHGLSHKAIAAFRDTPAALAVYWIYVSRMNKDGVAWPSAAGLARNTGWVKDTVLIGRYWLVEHEALEEVKDYIRPEWRNLDEKTKQQKLNLDRSEYYRPTGYIILNEKKYPMLYHGGNETSDIESEDTRTNPPIVDPIDHRPDRPTTPSTDDPVGLNLVSSSEPDPSLELEPIKDSPPPPAASGPPLLRKFKDPGEVIEEEDGKPTPPTYNDLERQVMSASGATSLKTSLVKKLDTDVAAFQDGKAISCLSPNYLYQDDPLFSQFVTILIENEKNRFSKSSKKPPSREHLVNMICDYARPETGWLAFQKRHYAKPVSRESGAKSTSSPFLDSLTK